MKRIIALLGIVFMASAAVPPLTPVTNSYNNPYTKVITNTATTGKWSWNTDSIMVYEVRVKNAGKIYVKLFDQASYKWIWVTDYDILRLRVTDIDFDSCTTDTMSLIGYPTRPFSAINNDR